MRVVPSKIAQRIQFYQLHGARFLDHAAEIGVSPDEAAELRALAAAAREAYAAQRAARMAAETATQRLRIADEAMSRAGAGLIRKVRAHAEVSRSDGVYALAWLPLPARPSPVGAPGRAYALGTRLTADGSLELTWRADHPAGCTNVIYQVYRRTDPAGEFAHLGVTGKRRFLDQTLPSGAAQVVYRIRGTRSTAVGDDAEFPVNFGTSGARVPKIVARAA